MQERGEKGVTHYSIKNSKRQYIQFKRINKNKNACVTLLPGSRTAVASTKL